MYIKRNIEDIEQVISYIEQISNDLLEFTFYRTKDGSEIDLVILKGIEPYIAIEIKFGSNPSISKGTLNAKNILKTKFNYIICNECNTSYSLTNGFKVTNLQDFLNELPEILID